ncbi:MAG: hypothetical protein ACLPYS_10515 [Vulcanimicrobiaceae bacterium]
MKTRIAGAAGAFILVAFVFQVFLRYEYVGGDSCKTNARLNSTDSVAGLVESPQEPYYRPCVIRIDRLTGNVSRDWSTSPGH